MILPLAQPISDHAPCQIVISTHIPKASVFRFENFWIDHPGFFEVVTNAWNSLENRSLRSATVITTKFKKPRYALK
jgi:hypothetical protein